MTAPLLSVEHLTIRFGGLVAVNDVSFNARDREITAYRAPKDPVSAETPAAGAGLASTNNLPSGHPAVGPNSAEASGAQMAATAVPTAGGADLTWSAPAAWQAKPLSTMRKGSFSVKGDGGEADLALRDQEGAGPVRAAFHRTGHGLQGVDVAAPVDEVVGGQRRRPPLHRRGGGHVQHAAGRAQAKPDAGGGADAGDGQAAPQSQGGGGVGVGLCGV